MMVGSATYLLLAVMSMVYDRFKNPVRTDSYDGEYDSEGKFDGYGRLVITDGSAYEGQFSQGQYHGIGRYQSSEETTILSKFVHNTPVGFARKQLVGGAFLEGYFSTDRPHGFGTFANVQGSILSDDEHLHSSHFTSFFSDFYSLLSHEPWHAGTGGVQRWRTQGLVFTREPCPQETASTLCRCLLNQDLTVLHHAHATRQIHIRIRAGRHAPCYSSALTEDLDIIDISALSCHWIGGRTYLFSFALDGIHIG